MSVSVSPEQAVRATIDALINAGTSFNIDALDKLYHDDLHVVSIDETGQVNIANKAGFKAMFEHKLASGAAPLSTWAHYDHVQANDQSAHVLITRKVNLVDQDQVLTLSIDLTFEDDRWQVTREVIFARPDE